jgi:hypothetical protein
MPVILDTQEIEIRSDRKQLDIGSGHKRRQRNYIILIKFKGTGSDI